MSGLITKTKFMIRDMLCNNITGSLISSIYGNAVPDMRWKGYRFKLPVNLMSKTNVAAVFWGFYESAEIRLIKKYLDKQSDVIELGSSVGVVSSHIASALQPGTKLLCIEANPSLIPAIQNNIANYAPPGLKYEVINCAIDYQSTEVNLQITGNNTETRVMENGQSGKGVTVKALRLTDLMDQYQVADFTLVSDIEGSEIQYLIEDTRAMAKCRNLCIELHDTKYKDKHYTVDDLVKLITTQLGFSLVERQGPVCFFSKKQGLASGQAK